MHSGQHDNKNILWEKYNLIYITNFISTENHKILNSISYTPASTSIKLKTNELNK